MSSEDGTMLMHGFEDAFVGGLRKVGQKLPIAVYDYQGCVDILMNRDGMTDEEAIEFIESQSLSAYFGAGTPCMVYGCTLEEFKEECADDLIEATSDPRDPDEDEEDADRDPGDEDPKGKESEEEIVAKAMLGFAMNFMEYINQVDPEIYSRAKNYAMDYSQTDNVKFIDTTKPEDEKEGQS